MWGSNDTRNDFRCNFFCLACARLFIHWEAQQSTLKDWALWLLYSSAARDVLCALRTLRKVRKVWQSAQLWRALCAKCWKFSEWPEIFATLREVHKKLKYAISFVFLCLRGKLWQQTAGIRGLCHIVYVYSGAYITRTAHRHSMAHYPVEGAYCCTAYSCWAACQWAMANKTYGSFTWTADTALQWWSRL